MESNQATKGKTMNSDSLDQLGRLSPTEIYCPGGCTRDLVSLADDEIVVTESGEVMCTSCWEIELDRKEEATQ